MKFELTKPGSSVGLLEGLKQNERFWSKDYVQRNNCELAAKHLSVRINKRNLNHHLWNNNGIWFVHATFHQGPIKRRVRASLGTSKVREARVRRDAWLKKFEAKKANVLSAGQFQAKL